MCARQQAPEPGDSRDVTVAAGRLGLTEFDFFRLCYRRWFGRMPDERALEQAFAAFMFRGHVPPWVRAATRQVLAADRAGTLDAEAYGAGRFRERATPPPRGRLYVAAAAAVWLVLFAMLLDTRYDPQTSAPSPACTAAGGSPLVTQWALLISGRPPPDCRTTPGAG